MSPRVAGVAVPALAAPLFDPMRLRTRATSTRVLTAARRDVPQPLDRDPFVDARMAASGVFLSQLFHRFLHGRWNQQSRFSFVSCRSGPLCSNGERLLSSSPGDTMPASCNGRIAGGKISL